jgi:hypothetical protein
MTMLPMLSSFAVSLSSAPAAASSSSSPSPSLPPLHIDNDTKGGEATTRVNASGISSIVTNSGMPIDVNTPGNYYCYDIEGIKTRTNYMNGIIQHI